MNKTGFLRGAMILTIAGILVKIIGAVNKIFISRILGGEGMGLYQMAYSIFNIMASLATIGIPVALSIIIAEYLAHDNYRGVQKIYRIALGIVLVLSVTMAIGVYGSAMHLHQIGIVFDIRAVKALKAVSIAIPFVAIMALHRGYFQGFQDMFPIGVSQVVEQIIRVVGMASLAIIFLPKGLELATAAATFANMPAAVGAVIVLLYYYLKKRKNIENKIAGFSNVEDVNSKENSTYLMAKRLIVLAIPIFIVPVLMPLMAVIDTIIVPSRLAVAGLVGKDITAAFGYLTGMANSLVNLPVILTTALATSLVPAISEAKADNDMDKVISRTESMMKLSSLITFPAAMGMIVLAKPISLMLYATPNAGIPLMVLSVSMIFLGWQQITTSVLQGLGYTAIPTINLSISMVFKIAITWYLTAMPLFEIKGAALATDVIFALAFFLNMIYVYRYTEYRLNLLDVGKIMLATCLMGFGTYIAYNGIVSMLGNTLAVILAILVAICLYCVGVLLFRAITREELYQFPVIGAKLKAYTKRYNEE